MVRSLLFVFAACALAPAAVPAAAPRPPANPQIDYRGFLELTEDVEAYRAQRLVGWEAFAAAARKRGALILDARSAEAFRAGHIKGAVNLPFTDCTAESLAATIGRSDRPILIYCNNNFRNDVPPVAVKAIQLALNIQTFINLVGYGYKNVYELNDVVDFDDPKVGWVHGARLARR